MPCRRQNPRLDPHVASERQNKARRLAVSDMSKGNFITVNPRPEAMHKQHDTARHEPIRTNKCRIVVLLGLLTFASICHGAESVDEVDVFHGALGKANLFPVAVRPFGLASIGPNWRYGVTTYSCAHVQGTGGPKWNYLAPTFALTTGAVSPDAPALKLSVGMEKLQYEGRAGSLRVATQGLGYAAEIVATLRGGMIVARSIDGKPLNVVFPVGFYADRLRNKGTCSLIVSNGVSVVEVMQDAAVPVFGHFEFNVAPRPRFCYRVPVSHPRGG
jgi:hypothetical protein